MKKYFVYIDDGVDCFKLAVPANSEDEAREYVQGNGEVVAIKDATADVRLDGERVAQALFMANFHGFEVDFIVRALREIGMAE